MELRDINDYIVAVPDGVSITASTLNARVGEAVTLTFTGSVKLDTRSRVPQKTVTDLSIGMCFTRGLTVPDEAFIDPHSYCNGEAETLPSNYRLLDGTNYYKTFADVTVLRGETRTFEHSFTFTVTEADTLVLKPTLTFREQGFEGPSSASLTNPNSPTLTFE